MATRLTSSTETRKVDFYILSEAGKETIQQKVCQLTYQAWNDHLKVYLYCENEVMAQQLDDALWTFKDISFIPHAIITDTNEQTSFPPCVIGIQSHPMSYPPCNILINLTDRIPSFFNQYSHIIEIVPFDPTLRVAARDRYKTYKKAGYYTNTFD
jgi:DNA polymerase-3 subunit chi